LSKRKQGRFINPIYAAKRQELKAFRASSVPVVVASSAEEGKPASFSMTAYTGGPLRVPGYQFPIVLDLTGTQFRRNVIANLDHDSHKRVGQVTETVNDGKQIILSGLFSAATEACDEVINSSRRGFEWEASIEAQPHKLELVAAGEQVGVNGQVFAGPVYVARQSTVFGVGFVGQGADENTTVSIAASAAGIFGEGSNMGFEAWVASLGFDAATLSEPQKAALMKSYEASGAGASTEVDASNTTTNPEDPNKMIAGATFDIDGLKAVYASHEASIDEVIFEAAGKVPTEKLSAIKANALTAAVKAKQKAVQAKMPVVSAQLEFERALSNTKLELIRAERPQGPAIHSSTRDYSQPVIEAAFAQHIRSKDLDKHYDDKTLQSAHTQFRGGMGLQRLLIMAAAQNGMYIGAGEKIDAGNIREVLQYCFSPVRAAGFSTISVSGLLSNVANKEILDGYKEEDQTWREVAGVKSVSDFKQVTSYRMLDNMIFEKIGPAGEIKHGTLSEESYTRQADTYAKMASLTRKDIINDDLGAFDDMKNRLGGGAGQKLNSVFWTAFLDNAAFFTSGRGNYITGSTTTLLTDGVGLQSALEAFRKLKSPSADGAKKQSGNTVGGRPEILLVPPELEFAADKLYVGELLNVGSGPGEPNIHRNKYRPVICPWLSDSSITNYSTTGWYLLRNSSRLPAAVVSFLNGQESPTVESADADFSTLGIQFRGYFDFGCDLAEYLCGIKSKGAA
jgi:phage major head subunit gpT-like protein